MSNWAQAETERILANMIRVGVVAELDEANALVKVNTGGLTTDWLPWITARAAATRTWSAPRPGEQVLVLSPYGDTAQALVLPALYQEAHPAPAESKNIERTIYPDGAEQSHNSANSEYLLEIPAGGKITLKCGATTLELSNAGVVLTAPNVDFNLG